jgi:hypothetical protein
VRLNLTARRAGVPAVAAVIGALVAAPAFADVSVTPTTAVQASGQDFQFKVTNTGTKPLNTISVRLPADEAIAELYPLSVPDWAPKLEYTKLATPLETIMGGTPVSEAATGITWIAVPGKTLAPGQSTDLSISGGPLPTLSSIHFSVTTTYAGGGAGPASDTTVTLTPGTGVATGHSGHDAAGTTDPDAASAAEDAAFAKAISDADRGPSILAIGGWVVAGLALAGMGWYLWRGRHRAGEDDEPDDEKTEAQAEESTDDAKEPVSAGASDSKWSFKG